MGSECNGVEGQRLIGGQAIEELARSQDRGVGIDEFGKVVIARHDVVGRRRTGQSNEVVVLRIRR
jgi:hypothetical protein